MDDGARTARGIATAMSIEFVLIGGAALWAYDAAVNDHGVGFAVYGVVVFLAIALAIRLLAGTRARRNTVEPLANLNRTLERLTNNDWSARVRPRGGPGVVDAGFNLNLLAEQTQTQLTDLRNQRDDLIGLIDSLPDPIVLADAQQRVSQLNAPAALLLSVTARQARGQQLVWVLGERALVDLVEALLAGPAESMAAESTAPESMTRETPRATPREMTREITLTRLGQKFVYQAVAARTGDGGLLLTLRDVTRMAATVQMKTDFVANASHELRTPITAIKIAFDTLGEVYEEDIHQGRRCMQIIAGHMKRLEDMLQDLMDLSRVENAEIKPEWTLVRSADVLTTVRHAMGPQAEAKHVTVEAVDEIGDAFVSERKLLDLVLKNLVENAVKFTPAGGTVVVTLARRNTDSNNGEIVASVADTGIGIPPQHVERVFERFYQVDAARSGTSGRGTGLGLAIVKHAIAALGGQLTLDSQVGRGTTFTCVLPVVALPMAHSDPSPSGGG